MDKLENVEILDTFKCESREITVVTANNYNDLKVKTEGNNLYIIATKEMTLKDIFLEIENRINEDKVA